ncbi:hypothetical protein IM660_08060 [Ruania alkalisoli]|uniref:Lipoprotein n=1 Tax=Ruania alkalisoli TaxID=2779775 RepID=A0A7M1SYX6_9MICO|nr:hypothetical protein [Ruania alkalisoli]QOR72174.1 hypothetical protein IM660_08060 [Ruania alkalisoli]
MHRRSVSRSRLLTPVVLLTLVACTGTGSGHDAPLPNSDESSTTGADPQTLSLHVLDAPPGYERDGVVQDLSSDWSNVLIADDGCTLAARGVTADGVTPDLRAASIEQVQAVASTDGAGTPEATDLEMVTSGAGEGNDPAHTLMFVSSDWTTDDQAVRGLARVTNVQHYDGSQSSQTLALRFSCPGEEIDEAEWETVASVIRPVMHGQVDPDDPWAGTAG